MQQERQPRVSWATTGVAPPAAPLASEEDLKLKLARMQLASASQAREFRLGLTTQQTRAAAQRADPAAAAAAAAAARSRRKQQHEDAYDREVRLRKAKLDEEAKAEVAARSAKSRRDAEFLRQQMQAGAVYSLTPRSFRIFKRLNSYISSRSPPVSSRVFLSLV